MWQAPFMRCGTPMSQDFKKEMPQSEAAKLGHPHAAQQDISLIWRNATSSRCQVQGATTIRTWGSLGLTSFFEKLSKGQVSWAEVNVPVSTTCGSWLGNCFQKSTLQVHFSKIRQSVSKTKGTLSLPLLEVIMLTPRLESELFCSWMIYKLTASWTCRPSGERGKGNSIEFQFTKCTCAHVC